MFLLEVKQKMKETNFLVADAVFEGGGVKGIGLVGAIAVAEEKGYRWVNVAGTSAGAIVAALLAAAVRMSMSLPFFYMAV